MDKFISINHSNFLKGIMLVDGVVVDNEMIGLTMRSKKESPIFKGDFNKAYDLVN